MHIVIFLSSFIVLLDALVYGGHGKDGQTSRETAHCGEDGQTSRETSPLWGGWADLS